MTKWLTSMVLAAGLVTLGQAQAQQAVEVEGQKFEPTVALGGQTLNLNGVGLRKRAIFKVYVAGLYAGQKSTSAAALVNDKGARRVSLKMLRDVEAQSFIDSFNEGLKNNTPEAQLTALKPQVDALVATLKAIGEAKKGDVINFDYTPDGGTRITVNGQAKGSPIPGADFFSAVLRIWLGDKPADEALKKGMLGA
ncbi:MAG: chalcone isomerase family protein [Burkholderiaceae bacterium]